MSQFSATSTAESAPSPSGGWVAAAARIGYSAKGVVYLPVGGMAAAAAFGSGGRTAADSTNAFQVLVSRPFSSEYARYAFVGPPCQPRRWLAGKPDGLPRRSTSLKVCPNMRAAPI